MNVGGAVKLGKVLVTSAWPYINVTPHIGNLVGSVLSADVVARYYRLKGEEVVMVSGSDEHGTPIEVEAIRLGVKPKELTDRNHARVMELFKRWGISFDNYTRTESPVHKEFVQQHLMKIYRNGYIFTKETEMLYCEKCKRFLPDRFVEGKCPHCGHEPARGDQCDNCGRLLEPTTLIEPYCVICKGKPVIKTTKHWYFDLGKFSEKLAKYISENRQLPTNAKNFSLNLIKEGLKPRAVTRDVGWGIPAPFPEAEGKTIYVWVEAVLGYVSATIEYFRNIGNSEGWKSYWFDKDAKTLYFIGKDNIPFHTIILPALLMASHEDYNLPWNVSATEFLQFKGEKASKSLRIGIWIDEALELFPADYWRYFLIATRPETRDSNFSWEIFTEKINADLNDTFGNFIHRTLSFINKQFNNKVPKPAQLDADDKKVIESLKEKVDEMAADFEACQLQSAANGFVGISRLGNQYLNDKEPWNLVKRDKAEAATVIYVAAQLVKALAITSAPIIPFTADELWKNLNLPGRVHEQRWDEALKPLPAGHKIAEAKPLFRKIEADEKRLDEMLEKVRKTMAK
ncbi:MAG: methionine--tRNA ligase [Candidatus Bathyarchaeia archaeon]